MRYCYMCGMKFIIFINKDVNKYYCYRFNLSNPTGHVMHQQFNIQQLYVLPTLYLFCIYLRTNSDLCHLQHKLIGFI